MLFFVSDSNCIDLDWGLNIGYNIYKVQFTKQRLRPPLMPQITFFKVEPVHIIKET